MKEYMVGIIRQHQYYPEGSLEAMSEDEVREIYEMVIDWLS